MNGSAHSRSNGSPAASSSGATAGPVRSSSGTLEGRDSPSINDYYYDHSSASGQEQQRRDAADAKVHGRGGKVGEKEDGGALANGGSRVAGAHWTVSKPFTVDLEAAGVEG